MLLIWMKGGGHTQRPFMLNLHDGQEVKKQKITSTLQNGYKLCTSDTVCRTSIDENYFQGSVSAVLSPPAYQKRPKMSSVLLVEPMCEKPAGMKNAKQDLCFELKTSVLSLRPFPELEFS